MSTAVCVFKSRWKRIKCVWDITHLVRRYLQLKRPPNHALVFFSMLFLLKPISLWLWFNSYYSMWTGDWGARAKLFTIHFCHSSAFINRPGNAAKDHHSRCIPDETRWWLCGEDFCSETNPLRLRKKNKKQIRSLKFDGFEGLSSYVISFQYVPVHFHPHWLVPNIPEASQLLGQHTWSHWIYQNTVIYHVLPWESQQEHGHLRHHHHHHHLTSLY